MENSLDIKKSILTNFECLYRAVLNTSTSFVEEVVVNNYHRDLKKAQELFNCKRELLENFMTEEEAEEEKSEDDSPIYGFVAGDTSTDVTGSVFPQFSSRKKVYSKVIFLKKISKAIILLKNELKRPINNN